MLKLYIELFLESSFANQSQTFSDILKSVNDENEIKKNNIKIKSLEKEKENIDFEIYSALLNRNIRPRSLQFLSRQPKKRQ